MRKDQLLEKASVRLFEVTGTKDKNKKGEFVKAEIQKFESGFVSWGTLSAIGASFEEFADNIGVCYVLEYDFCTIEG